MEEEISRIFLGIYTQKKKKKEETNSIKHSNVEFRKRMEKNEIDLQGHSQESWSSPKVEDGSRNSEIIYIVYDQTNHLTKY